MQDSQQHSNFAIAPCFKAAANAIFQYRAGRGCGATEKLPLGWLIKQNMNYQIRLQQFEGPLDVLLNLIEKRKLSINEVSLREVTDQYLEYIKGLEHLPLEEVASFLVIAATLILIKSKSLLPSMQFSEEEEGSIEDLEQRLRIYKRIRELGRHIRTRYGKNFIAGRDAFFGVDLGFVEPTGLTKQKLVTTLRKLIANLPKKEVLPEATIKKIVSLEEKMQELVSRIRKKLKMSFSEVAKPNQKIETIISFIAVLELVRKGILSVNQDKMFGEIILLKPKS